MSENIFLRLPGVSSVTDPLYTEYSGLGSEALSLETANFSPYFYDLQLEGFTSNNSTPPPVNLLAGGSVFSDIYDQPYFPKRDINQKILPRKSNHKFRGIKEPGKFLLFNQLISGILIRERNSFETTDLLLTDAEQQTYPVDADISSIYYINEQVKFYEWQRMRRFDARWWV